MKLLTPLLLLLLAFAPARDDSSYKDDLPVDRQATKETLNLYRNLKKLMKKGIMFGHQDDLAYGVGWKYEAGRSDVKDVTGDYPAVYGFELGHLEIDAQINLDSVPFNKMKEFIREVYERGGVVTLSWHLNNPLTGKSAWDAVPGTVASILPTGDKNDKYQVWLNNLAEFVSDLKGSKGELIPIIFRPYHELNGSWFWWGKNHCTPEQFTQLWKWTVLYLRDTKHVHNLLYAYNTDRFANKDEYLERYPGDEFVDILKPDYNRFNGFNQSISSYEDILQPGEIILFPSGWFHDVTCITNSISITWNFVHSRERPDFIKFVREHSQNSQLEIAEFFMREKYKKVINE